MKKNYSGISVYNPHPGDAIKPDGVFSSIYKFFESLTHIHEWWVIPHYLETPENEGCIYCTKCGIVRRVFHAAK